MPNLPNVPLPATPPTTARTPSRHLDWNDLFSRDAWRHLGDLLWHIALILLIYVLLRLLLRRLVDRGLAPILSRGGEKMDPGQAARLKTLAGLINSIIGYVLTFVFGVMLLRTFDRDAVPE